MANPVRGLLEKVELFELMHRVRPFRHCNNLLI